MPARRPLTFDTFVATRGSSTALDACVAAASGIPDAPRSLVLAGPSGCGKTHLLCALAAHVSTASGNDAAVVYTTAHDLRARLVLALRVGQPIDGLLTRPGTRLVVIDDLHTLRDHPGTQDAFARVWSSAVRAGVTVVGASSGTVEALAPLRGALGIGTAWIPMLRPDKAEAMRIFDSLVRGFQLPRDGSEARQALANWNGDVRRLVGAAAHTAFAARSQRPASPPPWVRSA